MDFSIFVIKKTDNTQETLLTIHSVKAWQETNISQQFQNVSICLFFETVELYYIDISVHGPPPVFMPRPVHIFVTPGYMYLTSSVSL